MSLEESKNFDPGPDPPADPSSIGSGVGVEEVLTRLRLLTKLLIEEGFRPELIVFAPDEIERIPGFKVALVIPTDPLPG
jgi:hypothetical protein